MVATTSLQQITITVWLDDRNGPAKLTQRQRELVAAAEKDEEAKEIEMVISAPDKSTQDVTTTNLWMNFLQPQWKPNKIISMFYDKRQKIITRGEGCKAILSHVNLVLNQLLALKDLYIYVSPKTSPLYFECKDNLHEVGVLGESLETMNTTLSRQEKLRSILREAPDIKDQNLTVCPEGSENSYCRII